MDPPSADVELPMVCTCREEGQASADALMSEVTGRLSAESETSLAIPVSMDNFLTRVVWSLNDDFGAHITTIDTDQWSAVTVQKYDGTQRVRVECDRVENGIAAIWKWLADGQPA